MDAYKIEIIILLVDLQFELKFHLHVRIEGLREDVLRNINLK